MLKAGETCSQQERQEEDQLYTEIQLRSKTECRIHLVILVSCLNTRKICWQPLARWQSSEFKDTPGVESYSHHIKVEILTIILLYYFLLSF